MKAILGNSKAKLKFNGRALKYFLNLRRSNADVAQFTNAQLAEHTHADIMNRIVEL